MDTEEFTFPITTDPSTSFTESPPLWRVSPSASPSCIYEGSRSTKSGNAKEQHHRKNHKIPRSSSTKDQSVLKQSHQRKSFSSVEGSIMKKRSEARDSVDDDDDEEEGDDDDDDDSDREEEEEEDKMDILWENLNEEMWKDRERLVKYNVSKGDIGFGCVPCSAKLSKIHSAPAAAVISNKKHNVLLITKLLKKMFLIQHTLKPVKKRSW